MGSSFPRLPLLEKCLGLCFSKRVPEIHWRPRKVYCRHVIQRLPIRTLLSISLRINVDNLRILNFIFLANGCQTTDSIVLIEIHPIRLRVLRLRNRLSDLNQIIISLWGIRRNRTSMERCSLSACGLVLWSLALRILTFHNEAVKLLIFNNYILKIHNDYNCCWEIKII